MINESLRSEENLKDENDFCISKINSIIEK